MSEKVKGLRSFRYNIQNLPEELENGVKSIVFANAKEIEAEAKKRAPVDTGKLRQAIKTLKVSDFIYKVKANATGLAPYSIFLEFGTRKMKKQPFLFPAFFKQKKQFIRDLEALLKSKVSKV